MNNLDVQFLQNIFKKQIPLTNSIGIVVCSFAENQLILKAPLNPNINDKGTAFGGSLYSMAVLTGWGFIVLKLKNELLTPEVVIHTAEITYRRPVTGEIITTCGLTSQNDWDSFVTKIRSGEKAKLPLTVIIGNCSDPDAIFKGTYYAR